MHAGKTDRVKEPFGEPSRVPPTMICCRRIEGKQAESNGADIKHVGAAKFPKQEFRKGHSLLSPVETASPRKEERSFGAHRRRSVVKVETDTQGSILDHLDVHSNVR
ncbi:Uncharacterized protein DBV15_01203 [Temnothorax longispinosus]|uniref:Uncharacterized protein n=1 Tax=Temnothorax longispinosus TaxID=300112 RepID=A0A4S2J9B2_9HYME|nr:Uncharacterized protein DBV15_01203 [Temnothorax longispinosus]